MSVPVSPTPEPREAKFSFEWIDPETAPRLSPEDYIAGRPVSSPTPDEQAAEEAQTTADWIRAEHEPWGDNIGDVHCVTHGLMRDYVQHLADALDARSAAASLAALVVVREQLTQAQAALVEIAHLHREVKNPYQEATGSPGVCINCSSWAYFTDGMGASVTWPCPTAALVPPPSPPTYTTGDPS